MAATVYSAVPQSSSRPLRFLLLALHASGGLIGGCITGALLGSIGRLVGPAPPIFLVAILVTVAFIEFRRVNLGLYQPQRGVPKDWLNWPRAAYVSAYGVVLGAGLFTPYGSSSVIALAAIAVLSRDVVAGALVLGLYGLTRAIAEIVTGIAATSIGLSVATGRAQVTKAMLRQPMGALALLGALAVALSGHF
ncbi:MAG: hypothetical protein AABM40_04410 [Chloroflexota bacterium]